MDNPFFEFSFPRPPSIFVGREKELNRLIEGFGSQNLIVIDGIAGIGKTTIALSLANLVNDNSLYKPFYNGNVFWITCKEDWELENLFYEINRWFKYKGEYLFEQCLEDTRMDIDERINYLIGVLNKNFFAIFIDDYQKLKNPEASILIEKIVQNLKNSKIIIISRERPGISTLIWLEIFEQKLHGLDNDASANLIKQLLDLHVDNIFEESMLSNFNRITNGHPFLIKTILCILFSGGHTINELLNNPSSLWESTEDYLNQVIGTLNEKERTLLYSFSIFRLPVGREAFRYVYHSEDVDTLIDGLQQKFLLNRYSENTYLIHDLLRHFCSSKLPDQKKKLIHKQCGFYYDSIMDDDRKLLLAKEAFYHYIQAEDMKRCVKILESIMDEMMRYLQLRELEQYIDRIPAEYRSAKINLMKSELLFIKEEYKTCMVLLEEAGQTKDNVVLSEIINLKARCNMGLQNAKKAMDYIDINLKNFSSSEDRLSYIKTLQIKGEINFELRNYEEALSCFKKALDINNMEIKNQDIKISLSLFTGMVMERQGRLEEALQIHLEALKLAEETSNFKEIPGLKINIGWDYYQLGELDVSYKFLREGMEVAHTDRLRIYSLYFAAILCEEKGDNECAFSYFSKALELSGKLADIQKQKIISTMLARLYLKTGKYKEARQILLENKYLPADSYRTIKVENLLILAELEIIENNIKEARNIISHVLDLCDRNIDTFQVFIAGYFMSTLSTGDHDKTYWRNECQSLLNNLFGHEKRKSLKYFTSDKLLFEKTCNDKNNNENYLVKIREKEYYDNSVEIEKLKCNMCSFELYIDVTGGTVWEKTRGFVDFSRKRNMAALLFHFVKNSGKSFSIEELYTSIWKASFNRAADSITVKTSISRLRKLLEPEPEKPKYVKLYSIPYQNESRYYFPEEINFCLIEKISKQK